MAKKQKRQANRPAAAPTAATPAAPAQQPAARPAYLSTSEFNPDYSYVKKDLRRIATLAVSFLGVLIALSFFLR